MNTLITTTTEKIKGRYIPEVGNTVGVLFGLHRPDANLGIITGILAFNEDTSEYDVKVAWYASNKKRRAHQENKGHNATGRVVARDTLDAINHAMEA